MKKKAECLQKLCEIENRSISVLTEKCLLSSLSTSEETTVSDFQGLSESSKAQPPQKRAWEDIINSHLAASLDISKLSDRKASVFVAFALKNAGCDPSEFDVNRSSIQRHCLKNRKSITKGSSNLICH